MAEASGAPAVATHRRVAGKRRGAVRAFQFLPPSLQQLRLMSWWRPTSPFAKCDGVICDGAIRSGKTVTSIVSFLLWSQATFDGEAFIIAGRSIGSLKRNVLRPLFSVLRAWGWTYTWHRSENWIRIGTNTYFLFGGSTEASQDDLAGLTAAGALVEETTRLNKSFVKEVVNRCSVEGAKVFFNMNPGGPRHWFKLEFVDKAASKNLLRLRFTLDDNPALADSRKAFYKRMFSGVWYRRFILGDWVLAEGLIFEHFDPTRGGRHVATTEGVLAQVPGGFERFIAAVDYGTAASAMTFGLYGLYRVREDGGRAGGRTRGRARWHAHLVAEYHYSGSDAGRQKTDSQYGDDFDAFVREVAGQLGKPQLKLYAVYLDPSAASFRAELRSRRGPGGRRYRVQKARNAVDDGNRFVGTLLSQGRFTVDPGCSHTIEEFGQYAWDPKAAEKGVDTPLKEHDHHMDRNRYALFSGLGKRVVGGGLVSHRGR